MKKLRYLQLEMENMASASVGHIIHFKKPWFDEKKTTLIFVMQKLIGHDILLLKLKSAFY